MEKLGVLSDPHFSAIPEETVAPRSLASAEENVQTSALFPDSAASRPTSQRRCHPPSFLCLTRKLPSSQPFLFYTASGGRWVTTLVKNLPEPQVGGSRTAHDSYHFRTQPRPTPRTRNYGTKQVETYSWRSIDCDVTSLTHQPISYLPAFSFCPIAVVGHTDFTSISLPHEAFSVHPRVKFPSALQNPNQIPIWKPKLRPIIPVSTGLSQIMNSSECWSS